MERKVGDNNALRSILLMEFRRSILLMEFRSDYSRSLSRMAMLSKLQGDIARPGEAMNEASRGLQVADLRG